MNRKKTLALTALVVFVIAGIAFAQYSGTVRVDNGYNIYGRNAKGQDLNIIKIDENTIKIGSTSTNMDDNVALLAKNYPAIFVNGSNGQVGIGTISPSGRLDLGGESGLVFDQMPSWNGPFIGSNIKASSTNGRLTRVDSSDTYYPTAIAFNYQDVGGFGSEDSKGGINFITTGSNLAGNIDPDTYSRMYIHKDGNIGIGKTNPKEKLDINGNLKINGKITSDGEICIGSGC